MPRVVSTRPKNQRDSFADLLFHGGATVTTRVEAEAGLWMRTSVFFDGDVTTSISSELSGSLLGPELAEAHEAELRALARLLHGWNPTLVKVGVAAATVGGIAATSAELVHLGLHGVLALGIATAGGFAARSAAGWISRRLLGRALRSRAPKLLTP